ncbi:hypothetical protein AURDEDRAFT_131322, partial [Auricularia subglabra TFB-10046 SS5]
MYLFVPNIPLHNHPSSRFAVDGPRVALCTEARPACKFASEAFGLRWFLLSYHMEPECPPLNHPEPPDNPATNVPNKRSRPTSVSSLQQPVKPPKRAKQAQPKPRRPAAQPRLPTRILPKRSAKREEPEGYFTSAQAAVWEARRLEEKQKRDAAEERRKAKHAAATAGVTEGPATSDPGGEAFPPLGAAFDFRPVVQQASHTALHAPAQLPRPTTSGLRLPSASFPKAAGPRLTAAALPESHRQLSLQADSEHRTSTNSVHRHAVLDDTDAREREERLAVQAAAARAEEARALEAQRLADEQAARERDERLAAEDAATRAEQARALEAQRLADQQAAREREERLVAEEEAAARDLYDAQE